MGPEEWEGAADELLEVTGVTAPVDVLVLAAECGLLVRSSARAGASIDLERGVIDVEARARPERQQGLVAHELGHFVLRRHGLPQGERAATYIGGCLRLPRRELSRDLARTAWSIAALRELHPNASATAIAVRITQLRPAVVALFDPIGRLRPWRVASESVPRELARAPTPLEHELAIAAWVEQREVRRGLCVATPLPDPERGEPRVLVVCDAEGLGGGDRHQHARDKWPDASVDRLVEA